MYNSIALPEANLEDGKYTVIFNDNKTLNLIKSCVRDGTASSQLNSFVYDYENGIVLYEEKINIQNTDYVFTSQECDSRDQGRHGIIVVNENSLYTPRAVLLTPIYLIISITMFIISLLLIKRLIFGKSL